MKKICGRPETGIREAAGTEAGGMCVTEATLTLRDLVREEERVATYATRELEKCKYIYR